MKIDVEFKYLILWAILILQQRVAIKLYTVI